MGNVSFYPGSAGARPFPENRGQDPSTKLFPAFPETKRNATNLKPQTEE